MSCEMRHLVDGCCKVDWHFLLIWIFIFLFLRYVWREILLLFCHIQPNLCYTFCTPKGISIFYVSWVIVSPLGGVFKITLPYKLLLELDGLTSKSSFKYFIWLRVVCDVSWITKVLTSCKFLLLFYIYITTISSSFRCLRIGLTCLFFPHEYK